MEYCVNPNLTYPETTYCVILLKYYTIILLLYPEKYDRTYMVFSSIMLFSHCSNSG